MHPAILVGAGFLAGTAGVKALTSKTAHKIYVKGLVQGLKAKECCESMVEEAKAQFDDIMAEAEYEVKGDSEEAGEEAAEAAQSEEE
jgi:hypothetical protein